MKKILFYIKKEAVLFISAVCAIISVFFVTPDREYLLYIDFRVLCQLFCLMAVVAGLTSCGLPKWLAQKLLQGKKNLKILYLLLIWLPFFLSMLITNDVSLIVFVPFTLYVLKIADHEEQAVKIIVLQTMAANLGSMVTPIGNPQNLFLYSFYSMQPQQFMNVMLPLGALSFVLLSLCCLFGKNKSVSVAFTQKQTLHDLPKLYMNIALLILCVLSVFRILPYFILLAIVLICFLLFERRVLLKVDYALLLTFVCFFILSGNLSRIPQIYSYLNTMMEHNTMLCSVIVSQFISNVPAAVLLAEMTADWKGLLIGVNIGGLGTPIASLASLISLKIYLNWQQGKAKKYLLFFLVANILFLLLLYLFAVYFL